MSEGEGGSENLMPATLVLPLTLHLALTLTPILAPPTFLLNTMGNF